MKTIEKTKAYKQIEKAREKKAEIGQECEQLRRDIESLIDEKRDLERQHDKQSIDDPGAVTDWAESRKKIKGIESKIDAKADKLNVLIGSTEKYKDEITKLKKDLYKVYFNEAETKRNKLFELLEKALHVNQKLQQYEAESWDPMGLARAGHSSPALGFLERLPGFIKQNKTQWQRMKERKAEE